MSKSNNNIQQQNQKSTALVERPKMGLTSNEALELRKKFGLNKLPEKGGRSWLTILMAQFKNPLIYIITVAAIISLIIQEYQDAIIIGVVIVLDCIVGFFQEYRAEKTMKALRGLLRPIARVYRNGELQDVDITEIVPGDLIALNPGDKVAADGSVLETVNLSLNEAILTGESESIMKRMDENLYMGTIVLSGRGLMKVTATGIRTELGKIAESLSEIKDEGTPLQFRLEKFGKTLTYLVIIICVGIFITGILLQFSLLEMVELSVVLAIAAIPEGLIIAVTLILVIGMRAILRRKGLVKKLLAVETLGSVSTICTDKTGTLTEGIMKVVRIDFQSEQYAVYTMALCNNKADSLEISLWEYITNLGKDPQNIVDRYPRVYEVPFSSEKKYMLTTHIVDGNEVGLLKGAPDVVMDLCNLDDAEKQRITAQLEEWASTGLRLLGLAYKTGDNLREIEGYSWNGFIGIEDPIRPSVRDTIILCRRAGIKVKMITGDYRKTAEKVAMNLGLAVGPDQIIEGKDLELMSESKLASIVENAVIFCRVSPHHKLKIVNALQMCGEITAMIGDGVNDAPALKKANIGVSVGNATDVAKETASLILLDNNFGTLVNAVEEGRVVFDNIKKVVAYVLSNSFAEILIIFVAFLLGWPVPLTIAQILWIHLICDGPSDIALGFERAEKGIMETPPRDLNEKLLDSKNKILILAISSCSSVLCLSLFYYFVQMGDLMLARTVVFAILAVQSLIYIFSYRSLNHSIFKSGKLTSNKPLIYSVILGLSLIFVALYVPGLNQILEIIPLGLYGWILVLCVAFLMVAIVELVKYTDRKIRGSQLKQVYRIIRKVQSKLPDVQNMAIHNLSVDIMKDKLLLQFHFKIPPETPLITAHDIASMIEKKIAEEFPMNIRRNLEIISHIEPLTIPSGKMHSHSFRPISPEIRQIVENTLKNFPNVKNWDRLNVIEEGKDIFLSMTTFFDREVNIAEVHRFIEEIEIVLRKQIPSIKQCNIHAEPIQT